jgi:serine/threonine protein kinase
MLQSSLPASTASSRPSSPTRRIQAGLVSSASARTPPGAEFVASSPAPNAPHGISSTAFSQNYFKNFFVEERELGRGNKGVVLLVKHVLDGVSLGHFALKRIPVGDNHRWLEKVLVEVQLLQHLSHQNLVSYRHVWLEEMQITTFGPPVPCAFILQQYCNAGDLHNYIFGELKNTTATNTEKLKQRLKSRSKSASKPPPDVPRPRKLQFEEIYAFFKDIASGLNHLHIHNYIHRDLKPNNCLLHSNGKELRVLVSDFGEVQSEDQMRQSTGATGTISYCSPEVLRRDPVTGRLGNFTTKSDIFSLGMILHFLCFAKLPYRNADSLNDENEDIDLLRDEIIGWSGLEDLKSVRPDLPEELYKFLRRLLSLDPSKRPTAEDILQGIKTGSGLEEAPEEVQGHVYEDIQSEPRISPIDSSPSESPARTNSIALSRFNRHHPPSNLKFPIPSESSTDMEAEGISDVDGPASPNGSLILRSRHSSPVRLSTSPTPTLSWLQRIYFMNPQQMLTIKTAGFLIKIVSIYLPCLPAAAQPTTGLLLLALATVDLLLFDFGFLISVVLLALHFLFLILSIKSDALCIPKIDVWEVFDG